MPIAVTYYSDPGCPWAYSAIPALTVLSWRYGEQLRWRLVTIGLSERREQYAQRGYTPERVARGYIGFRRFGMPFSTEPRAHVPATARACRALVATRLDVSGRELDALRALQLGWFTSSLVLDEDEEIAVALARVPDLDAGAIVSRIDDPDVVDAYAADRAEARSAAGGPTELQGKAAATDGPVRFTAPSVIFEVEGRRLEAGGFQTLEAYDVLLANLDPSLDRRPAASEAAEVLERFPAGVTTQEAAAVMTAGNDAVDRPAAEAALIELVGAGRATRTALGDDALWAPA